LVSGLGGGELAAPLQDGSGLERAVGIPPLIGTTEGRLCASQVSALLEQ